MKYIDKAKQNSIKKYISLLKLNGEFYGKPFVLLPWQEEFLDNVYGTVDQNGYRVYNYAYLEIPKKNGKTELIAAIASYHLITKPNEQIYCCAADKEQATLIYDAIIGQIDQDEFLTQMKENKELKIYTARKKIVNVNKRSVLTVLSAESYTKHGLNPTVVIFDELHAQPNRELWDVMTFGSGSSRKEPLYFVITTAGDDPDRLSIGWEIHEKSKKLIDGMIEEPNWYCKIYGLDAEDESIDIYDEQNWYKANPSLGTTISIDTLRKEAISAKNSPSQEKLFRWLRLNMWMSLKKQGWLDRSIYKKNINKLLTMNDLKGKICYIGIDLSSINDLTSIAFVFPKQKGLEKITIAVHSFVPEDNERMRRNRDKVPYDRWIKEGYITATQGNVIDYNYVKWFLRNANIDYIVKEFGEDPWQSEKLRQDLELQTDLTLEEARKYRPISITSITQNIAMFSPTMKEIERLLGKEEMWFIQNPVVEWALGNVIVISDGNDNIKPDKKRSRDRIDPMVAIINAFYLLIKNGGNKVSVYEKRGVRTI